MCLFAGLGVCVRVVAAAYFLRANRPVLKILAKIFRIKTYGYWIFKCCFLC